MKAGFLFSGGKDSTFAIIESMRRHHEATCLITVHPTPESSMFHYPNTRWTRLQAQALELPQLEITADAQEGSEKGFLSALIAEAKYRYGLEAIVSGTIASAFQKKRIDIICAELGLVHEAPLWGTEAELLLRKEIESGIEAIVTACMAWGLTKEILGRRLEAALVEELKRLSVKYGINLTFEGGEAETFVLDAPIFSKRIRVLKSEIVWKMDSGYLQIRDAELVPKLKLRGESP